MAKRGPKPKEGLTKCHFCGKSDLRLSTGTRPSRGSGLTYVNASGLPWQKFKCPTCYDKRIKRRTKKKSDRKCRLCGIPLPKRRYFHCETCVWPNQSSDCLGIEGVYETASLGV